MLSDSRKVNYLLFVLYKLILDVTYITVQSEVFDYSGYDKVISSDRITYGWLIFLITTIFVCRWKGNLFSLFLYLMHIMTLVPFIVFYQFYVECELWMVIIQAVCIVFMMTIFQAKIGVKSGTNTPLKFSSPSFQFVLIAGLLLYFLISFMRFGIPTLESMLFANVYETRADNELPLFLVLLQNLFCKILLPICILWYAKSRHWVMMSICLIVQIYTYAVTGLKTYLFIPFVLLGIMFFNKLNLERIALCGMMFITVIVDFLYFIGQDVIWYALVGNRLIFLPARIKYSYFDYFSHHDFANFSQSSFAHILGVKSNYLDNIPNMIGEIYFDKPQMWTNTGFIADAYSNLGIIGVAMMALLLAVVLKYANSIVSIIPAPYNMMVKAIFLIFFIALNDGAVISVLVSGGMLAAVFLFRYLNFSGEGKIPSNAGYSVV